MYRNVWKIAMSFVHFDPIYLKVGSCMFLLFLAQPCHQTNLLFQTKNSIAKLWTTISTNNHIIHMTSTDNYGAIIGKHLLLFFHIAHVNSARGVLNKNSSVFQSQAIIGSCGFKAKTHKWIKIVSSRINQKSDICSRKNPKV